MMYPKIYEWIKKCSGVLVVLQYQQWRSPNAAGNNPPQLLSVMIGPACSSFESAHRIWQQQSKIMQGPDKGMVYGPKEFLWFTRDLSAAELIEQLNKTEEKEYWKAVP